MTQNKKHNISGSVYICDMWRNNIFVSFADSELDIGFMLWGTIVKT